ncbi:sensor histidine kinase [Deinococcus pimensis]|uniref:sensor histidine kinase n=1 Tax=Deinococcus pimensis TaxID=309888 RepID=UPI00146FC49D|nr:histidine kinase [Deinococcus pimensis]
MTWNPQDVLLAVAILTASALTLYLDVVKRQNRERKALIDELRATRADLAQAERHAGVLEERERLARDLHDTLAQGFASIVMNVEVARHHLRHDHARTEHALTLALRSARTHLEEVRREVRARRTHHLDKEDFPLVLTRAVHAWAAETDVIVTVRVKEDLPALHPQQEVTLLRVTQEALAHIQAHAVAHEVRVTVTAFPDRVTLDVMNDGAGFNLPAATSPAAGQHGDRGLSGMRARVTLQGGHFDVKSHPRDGMVVSVSLPLVQAPRIRRPEQKGQEDDAVTRVAR